MTGSRTARAVARARTTVLLVGAMLMLAALVTACSNGPTPSASLPSPDGVWLQEGDGAVTVHWNPVADAGVSGYQVSIAAVAGSARAKTGATADGRQASEATVDGLTNGTAYRFQVVATGQQGLKSDPSNAVLGAPFSLDATPIASIEVAGDAGTAVLDDGRRFALLSRVDLEVSDLPAGTSALRTSALQGSALPPASSLPPAFTLAAYQTNIRSQGRRDTCQTFAAVAAMEAAYARLGYPGLDLSEQYASHLMRTVHLHKTPGATADVHETTLGTRGGWGASTVYGTFEHYGLPVESVDPYVVQRDYQRTNQAGDVPRIDPTDDSVTQRAYDDFNLQDQPTTYSIPGSLTTTPLPRDALTNAPYGVTSFTSVPNDRRNDPTWYKQTLYSGKEIALAFCFHGITSDNNGVWRPGSKSACLGHQVLLIGYDATDPDHPYFIAKNSWGGSSYQKVGYGFITDDANFIEAVVLTGVRDPSQTGYRPQRALGRWDLVGDGEKGTLDITRLSGFYPASRSNGQQDHRLGAFFDPSNAPYRVNGSVDASDRGIDFWYDPANPALDYETLSGTHFTGALAPGDATLMAGTYIPAGFGSARGFYARKDGPYSSVPGGTSVQPAAFLGRWRVHGLGMDSVLVIDSVLSTGAFEGSTTHDGGAVNGLIDPATRHVNFRMADASGVSGDFEGSVHVDDLGTISGSFTPGGQPGGLVLIREGDVPDVAIDQVGTLREDGALALSATASNFVEPSAVTIEWSYQTSAGGASTQFATSSSGETFTATVPCDDLILHARAVDAGRGLSAEDVATVSCTPATETRRFYIDRTVSGWVNDNGKAGTAAQNSILLVGDGGFDEAYVSLLTFPWVLPAGLLSIEKAEVTVSLSQVEGAPYSGLNALKAYQVDYGASLDIGDFNPSFLPGAATLPFDGSTTFGTMNFDMTTAMQDAWANRGTRGDRLQLELKFGLSTDNDGQADRITLDAQDRVGTTLLPFVDITFRNY